MGLTYERIKAFFHYRKRIKTGDVLSVYGAKETQKLRN